MVTNMKRTLSPGPLCRRLHLVDGDPAGGVEGLSSCFDAEAWLAVVEPDGALRAPPVAP